MSDFRCAANMLRMLAQRRDVQFLSQTLFQPQDETTVMESRDRLHPVNYGRRWWGLNFIRKTDESLLILLRAHLAKLTGKQEDFSILSTKPPLY